VWHRWSRAHRPSFREWQRGHTSSVASAQAAFAVARMKKLLRESVPEQLNVNPSFGLGSLRTLYELEDRLGKPLLQI
jgi:hypothetical protein